MASKSKTTKPRKAGGYPVGRPTVYKKKYAEMLFEHMALGYSIESFGGEIGVSKRTLYNWMEKHTDFLYAKEKGDMAARLWWEKAGRKGMLTKGFNAAVWIFNMKNRCGWSDRADDNTEKTLHTVRIELPNAGAAEVITAGERGEDDGTTS